MARCTFSIQKTDDHVVRYKVIYADINGVVDDIVLSKELSSLDGLIEFLLFIKKEDQCLASPNKPTALYYYSVRGSSHDDVLYKSTAIENSIKISIKEYKLI